MGLQLNAKVVGKMEFSPGNFVLRVAPLEGAIPEYIAGQYAALGLFGSAPRSALATAEETPTAPESLVRRAYSISSDAHNRAYLEFYISLVKHGALSPRLYQLNIGDQVWLGPKITGGLTMEKIPNSAAVVMMATGTGLAPFISILRSQLTAHGKLPQKVAIIHGVRNSWELGYRNELELLQKFDKNLCYLPILSEAPKEVIPWPGLSGFVESVWKGPQLREFLGFKAAPDNTHIMLCGNPLMIESAMKFLGEENFKEHTKKEVGQIHIEKFW